MQFNVHQAKTSLSKLLADAERGEEVVIARNGVPAVRLVPIRQAKRRELPFGVWKGRVEFADDFTRLMPRLRLRSMHDRASRHERRTLDLGGG